MVLVPDSKAHPTGLLFNRSKAHDDATALYRQYLGALIVELELYSQIYKNTVTPDIVSKEYSHMTWTGSKIESALLDLDFKVSRAQLS